MQADRELQLVYMLSRSSLPLEVHYKFHVRILRVFDPIELLLKYPTVGFIRYLNKNR